MKRLLCAVLFLGFVVATSLPAAAGDVPLTPLEQLGKFIFFDKISQPGSMSCAECHAPSVGFTGPIPGLNHRGAVYRGAVPQRFGNRKPPASSYASFSPIFHYNEEEGLFMGGNFWDGRATGWRLGSPTVEQALGPFLNPVEQNAPSREWVLERIAGSQYAWLWEEVWGEPISTATPLDVSLNYDRIGFAIGAYEASWEVNQFSSKFDYFWANAMEAGKNVAAINVCNWMEYEGLGLSNDELEGFALFNDESKGKCALCHTLDPAAPGLPPLFTDNSFDNLGIPKNPYNPFYDMDEVYLDDGSPINPEGDAWIDPGLGGFLASMDQFKAMAAENWGKHRVPTLRNVGKRPGERFIKAFSHNGFFKSLYDIVHFYNTRDVETWPAPEVLENMNTDELGDLGLSLREEELIVLFMETLSDGYKVPKKPVAKAVSAGGVTLTPNPFNPTTRIAYTVPADGIVDLAVYDVAGRRVKVLAAGWKSAGDYSTDFNATGMASGVYFVRLATGGVATTTRAILLK